MTPEQITKDIYEAYAEWVRNTNPRHFILSYYPTIYNRVDKSVNKDKYVALDYLGGILSLGLYYDIAMTLAQRWSSKPFSHGGAQDVVRIAHTAYNGYQVQTFSIHYDIPSALLDEEIDSGHRARLISAMVDLGFVEYKPEVRSEDNRYYAQGNRLRCVCADEIDWSKSSIKPQPIIKRWADGYGSH